MYYYTALLVGTVLAAVYAAPPTEWGIVLSGNGPWATATDVKLGDVVIIDLAINVPYETSPSVATKLELLSSVITTRFALGNIISLTNGANVNIGNAAWKTSYTKHVGNDQVIGSGIEYTTRAVFDLGDVSLNANSGTEADCQINIQYEAIYVSDAGETVPGSIQTSAGMELKDGSRIIISMLTFTAQAEEAQVGTPSFVVSSPLEITLLDETTGTVTFSVPDVSVPATITVSSDSGKVIVHEIVGNDVGQAFNLYVNATNISNKNSDSCPPPDSFSLYMGKLINTEAMRPSPRTDQYDIAVDFKMRVIDESLVGTVVYPSVTVTDNGSDIYVTTMNMTVLAPPPAQPLQSSSFTPSTTVPIAQPGVLSLVILTHPKTIHSVKIAITAEPSLGDRAISIISVNPATYGSNLCPIKADMWNVTLSSSVDNAFKDRALVEFDVTNFGLTSGVDADNELTVNVVVMASGGVKDDIHTVSVDVNDGTFSESSSVTLDDAQSYPSYVNFNISIEPFCPEAVYEPATVVKFVIRIETEPDVVAGPFNMEFPIPPDTESPFANPKATGTKKGANTACSPFGEMPVTLSDWVENSGENDRGVVDLPLICNIQTVNSPEENVFEIQVQSDIKHIANQSEQRNLTYGLGIKYSETQVWVAIYYILVNQPKTYPTTKMITAIAIPDTYMPNPFPGDIVLQWSPDDVTYYEYKHGWGAVTQNITWTVKLKQPLLARYVRILNTKGMCMKDHDFVSTDAFPMYGSASKKATFMQSSEFFLDGDYDTCVDLPLTTETNMTPFMWIELPKLVFGISDNETAFKVNITGEGIQCRSRLGPQVTYVGYAKETPLANFQGKKMLCQHTTNSTVSAGKTLCEYECACNGASQCSQMSLFMMHKGSPVASYKLCEIEMALS